MLPLMLVVLILAVPVLEILVLVQAAQVIGGWGVILLLLAQGLLGSWIVKSEGRRAWRSLNETLASGRLPERGPADAALILAGGTLLALPGFLTDVPALLCLLPFTRPPVRRALLAWAARRAERAGVDPRDFPGPGSPLRPGDPTGPGVIRGEVIKDEEDGGRPERPLEP